uniref:hypothetical protein n=1 Tax=Cupriavidus taiwanensis TaxID=164546 RepID=UPI003D18AFA7
MGLTLRGQHRLVRLDSLPRGAELGDQRRGFLARAGRLGARRIALGFGRAGRRTHLGTQRGQLAGGGLVGGLVGGLPDGLHRPGGNGLQRVRQVRMVDGEGRPGYALKRCRA